MFRPIVVMAVLLLACPVSAHATISMSVTGMKATIVGDNGPDVLVVETADVKLRHNLGSDARFSSAYDFDTDLAGDQTLPATPTSQLDVRLGIEGPNVLTVHDTPGAFTETGVGGRAWSISAGMIVAPFATVTHDDSVTVNVAGSSSYDTFNVGSQGSRRTVTIDGGDGPDSIRITAKDLYSHAGTVHVGGTVADDTIDVVVTGSVANGSSSSSTRLMQLADRGVLTSTYDGNIASWGIGIKQVRYTSTGDLADNITVAGPLAPSTRVDLSLGAGADSVWLSGPAALNGGRIDAGDVADETFDRCVPDSSYGRECGDELSFIGDPDGVELDLQSSSLAGFELIRGTPGNDRLLGTDTDEWFVSGAGADVVDGRGGNDTFSAVDGKVASADRYIGGPGIDHVTYAARTEPLVISLDGIANDGARGESDNIDGTVENVTGGRARDTLIGNKAPNVLDGSFGSDTFVALAGKDGGDTFLGGAETHARRTIDTVSYARRRTPVMITLDDKRNDGSPRERDRLRNIDKVIGGRGNDTLAGSRGNDILVGGPGHDRLAGGLGRDILRGGAGNDRILARDRARDIVDGGPGRDLAVIDRIDRLVRVP